MLTPEDRKYLIEEARDLKVIAARVEQWLTEEHDWAIGGDSAMFASSELSVRARSLFMYLRRKYPLGEKEIPFAIERTVALPEWALPDLTQAVRDVSLDHDLYDERQTEAAAKAIRERMVEVTER